MAAKSSLARRLVRRIEANRDTDTDVDIFVNKDTRPLPPSRRTYGPWEFVGLWMVTGSFNVGGWTTGSSLISLGLNVWQSMIAIIIAHTFVGFVCIAGGHPGAMRVYDFVAFVLYFLLCLPLIWLSPENYRKPFLIASTTVATTVFVLLIWSTVRAQGGGALLADASSVTGVKAAKGGDLGWAFVTAVTANIGGIATHMWSQSDYTRYARKPGDQVLAQLIMVPLGTIIVACIGIICTSCAATLYPDEGKLLWQPYRFLDAVHRNEDTHGARAGVAFGSIAFMFSQFGMVVASNCVVAGIDLAALLPRWFTVRRGGYLTVACVFVMQPWSLLNSASQQLPDGDGQLQRLPRPADGHHVRRLLSHPQEDYEADGPVRQLAAQHLLVRPGLAQRAAAPEKSWSGWTRLYQLSWFVGCLASGVIYLALDRAWPMPDRLAVDELDYFGTFGDAPVLHHGVAELDVEPELSSVVGSTTSRAGSGSGVVALGNEKPGALGEKVQTV